MESRSWSNLHRCFLAALLLLVCGPAWAEKRVALVVGNSAYQNVASLPNPINDGTVIASTLKDAGFDVVDSRHDLTAVETRRALRDFADRARDADIALVYYAGHGIEVDGANYLIPVDARLERDTDVYDEALSLERILIAIEPAKRLRLVILDACRDNPFAKRMKRTLATRAIGQGLAKVEPTSPNVLIAYSAKAGSTAADGDGTNSPFTVALARHLTTPGLDVRRAFGYVRDDVLKITNNRQEPFVYGSLGGDDMALVPAKVIPPVAVSNPQIDARRDYELALQVGNKTALSAFLAQHPEGFYASLAKLQLDKISAEEIRLVATEKARAAEQKRARLASEGAQRTQQAKAEADARSAEQARLAAEQKRIAAEQALADKAAAAPVPPAKDQPVNMAALTAGAPQGDITKSVQSELSRVGCFTGAANGEWNAASQRALTLFNRHAGTRLETRVASVDARDAIKQKPSRVCPLLCEHGYRADGERCSKIVCREGTVLGDDNICGKRREKKPVAARDPDERPSRRERANGSPNGMTPGAASARPQASAKPQGGSGQIYCNAYLCRPVARGCRLEYRGGGGADGNGGNFEVCN